MDDVAKYGKTLDEIEGELMFGEIPDDLSDDSNIFDEYDAANEETFGAELEDIVDTELEDYAAQTARLRLDDPVWTNPTSSAAAAPDASQIPMPFSIFGENETFSTLSNFRTDSNFLDSSIWGNKNSSGNNPSSFGIWGSEFGLGLVNQSHPADPTLGDLSGLLGDDNTLYEKERKSPGVIPSMPTAAMTLEEIERLLATPQKPSVPSNLVNNFQNLSIASESIPPPSIDNQNPMLPSLPANAMSIEELERQLIQKTQELRVDSSKMDQTNMPTPEQIYHQQQIHQSQMIPPFYSVPPPLMMGLPKLPPLQQQFLPLVPIWLTHIVHRHPLPMGVPPPPPFLFQLMHIYKNPQLVHQMIMQSSIPPPIRMGGPLSPPQNHNMSNNHNSQSPGGNQRYQRKPPGMPSSRTIHDLALDSFAGYMSWKEREWLIKIQLLQCKGSGDPMVEDYYYTTWKKNNIAKGWKPKPVEESEPVEETKKDYMERIRRMNYREMQKERAHERALLRQKERAERAERGEDKKPKLTLSDKFATSLGLPSKSSTSNPRHLISMKNTTDNETAAAEKKLSDEERKIAVAKKLRTMLLRLEGAMTMLLDVDELQQEDVGINSKFKDLNREEKDEEIKQRTSLIINELMGDDLHKLLQMAKGRTVLVKTLKVVSPKDQARIILSIMTAGGLVNKKVYGEMVLDILPAVHEKLTSLHPDQFSYLVQALNIDSLKRQLLENNVFIRDIMLTLFLISEKNEQPLLKWASATKFPSLVLSTNKSLTYWRNALKTVNNSEIKQFANIIKQSDIRECEQLGSLIEQSLS